MISLPLNSVNAYKHDINKRGINMQLTDDKVLLIDLSGAVTRALAVSLPSHIGAVPRARAFVVRTDRALMMLGGQCLDAIRPQDVRQTISGAIVVPECVLEMMQDYAARLARGGVVRRVFTDRVLALEWATQQAQLAVAQEQWETARHPQPLSAG